VLMGGVNFRRDALRSGLETLAQPGCLATSFEFFSTDDIDRLKQFSLSLPMRKARPVVGAPGREVTQDFDICFPAPRQDALDDLTSMLEELIDDIAGDTDVLDTPFELNDLAVQHYPPQSRGIGVHMDSLRYRGLVFIITLDGSSRFCVCDDREGSGARVLDESPGRLGLLSAPGFAGREGEGSRPFHFVDRITGGRLSIGLRHNSKPPD